MPGPITDCCMSTGPTPALRIVVDRIGHLAFQRADKLGAGDDGRIAGTLAANENNGGSKSVRVRSRSFGLQVRCELAMYRRQLSPASTTAWRNDAQPAEVTPSDEASACLNA